jgi:hypothetical protein
MTAPRSTPTPRHWLPSITAVVFTGVLVFALAVFQEPLLNSDGDLPRHLRHGEWMLRHHALITTDSFSYTMAGRPFVGFEYGSQLLYAAAYRLGGLAAVTVLAALLIAAAYALLTRFMLRRGVEPLLAGTVVMAAMLIGMGHWIARPHLITLVAVPLLLELLRPLRKWRYWPFAPLFAVWANLHGGFVYGLVLIGLFFAAALLESLRAAGGIRRSDGLRRYAGALVIAAAAALANPWGVGVYRHIVAMFGDHYIIDHTAEFASPDFHDLGTKFFLVVIVGVIVTGFLSRRRPPPGTILVCAAGIWLALVNQRNATLFGFTALPLLAIHLDPEWREFKLVRRLGRGIAAGAAGAATAPWIVAAGAFAMTLGLMHGRLGSRQLLDDSFSPTLAPMRALAAARKAGLAGRVFTEFGWGGYLLYAWPEQKVFIDGGTDFYGGGLMRDYGIIRDAKPGWPKLFRRWNFAVMILPPDAPIATELTLDHGWVYWYCDSTAVVLVPGGRAGPPIQRGIPGSGPCAPNPEPGDPS